MYGEDGDLCVRFRAKGWKAVLFPKTLVYHHTPENNYTIQKRIWHGYAANINALKNINRSYLKNIFFLFKDYFKSSLNTILDLNKSELYVIHVSYFKTITRLKRIYQNRKISHRDKMPFLLKIFSGKPNQNEKKKCSNNSEPGTRKKQKTLTGYGMI